MEKIRLLLDEDVRPLLAEVLRQRGHDARHVLELNRTGKTDPEQLKYAVGQQRGFLTHNIKDFVRLHQEYHQSGREHFGILLSEQITFRQLLRRSLRFLSNRTAEEIRNKILWLTDET
jgi:predicted nuclease of predicted toxin-antitoxin system